MAIKKSCVSLDANNENKVSLYLHEDEIKNKGSVVVRVRAVSSDGTVETLETFIMNWED